MALFSTTSLALPFFSSLTTTDREEDERARREEEGSGGGTETETETEASVGNDDDDDDEADASAVRWIPVVCLKMAVTKEELGRTPTVGGAANLSADPCWREKAVNSVNTMKGVLK